MELFSGKWVLDDLAVIGFTGQDAGSFLHAQLTNSVKNLPDNLARPAAYCSAQGRVLANCFYWQMSEDNIAVVIAKDLAEQFVRRMKMFVLRSRLNINYLPEYKVIGLSGKDNLPPETQELTAWSYIKDRQNWWIKAPFFSAQSHMAWYISQDNVTGNSDPAAWYAMQIASGWPLIRQVVSERFLPSSLNMDINGCIDFQKGCYPGQEIIARSYYRGAVKRRLAFAHGKIKNDLTDLVFNDLYAWESKKPIGRIIDYAVYDGHIYVAAEINLSDINQHRYLLTENGPELDIKLIENQVS